VIGGGAAIGVYVHNQEQAKEAQAELKKEQQEQAELEKGTAGVTCRSY